MPPTELEPTDSPKKKTIILFRQDMVYLKDTYGETYLYEFVTHTAHDYMCKTQDLALWLDVHFLFEKGFKKGSGEERAELILDYLVVITVSWLKSLEGWVYCYEHIMQPDSSISNEKSRAELRAAFSVLLNIPCWIVNHLFTPLKLDKKALGLGGNRKYADLFILMHTFYELHKIRDNLTLEMIGEYLPSTDHIADWQNALSTNIRNLDKQDVLVYDPNHTEVDVRGRNKRVKRVIRDIYIYFDKAIKSCELKVHGLYGYPHFFNGFEKKAHKKAEECKVSNSDSEPSKCRPWGQKTFRAYFEELIQKIIEIVPIPDKLDLYSRDLKKISKVPESVTKRYETKRQIISFLPQEIALTDKLTFLSDSMSIKDEKAYFLGIADIARKPKEIVLAKGYTVDALYDHGQNFFIKVGKIKLTELLNIKNSERLGSFNSPSVRMSNPLGKICACEDYAVLVESRTPYIKCFIVSLTSMKQPLQFQLLLPSTYILDEKERESIREKEKLMKLDDKDDNWYKLFSRGNHDFKVVSIHCDNSNIYYILVDRPTIEQANTSQRLYRIFWIKYDELRLEFIDSLDFIRFEPTLTTELQANSLSSHVFWGSHQAYPFLCVLSPSLHYVLYFFNLSKKKIEFTGEDKQLAVLGRKIGPHSLGGVSIDITQSSNSTLTVCIDNPSGHILRYTARIRM